MSQEKKTVSRKTVTTTPSDNPTTTKTDGIIFEEEGNKVSSVTTNEHAELLSLIKDLKSEVDSLKAEKNNYTTEETVEEKRLSDDYLEIPLTFFAYSISFRLYGDKRRGVTEGTPTGEAVVFKPHYRYNNKKGSGNRGTDTVSVCRAVVYSKSTAEWLRNHSQFGIKFFETISSAVDQDVFLAEKMVQVSNMVNSLGDMQVIKRATQEGINVTDPDISNIRQQLIKKIATSQIESQKKAQEAKAKAIGMVEERKIGERAAHGDKAIDVY